MIAISLEGKPVRQLLFWMLRPGLVFVDIVAMWILICVTIVSIWKEGSPFATG